MWALVHDQSSKDLMIEIMNQARYFIPHLLALSTSSPFWHGYNTGLKSYRSVVFEMLPRTGIPHSFQSWAEYKAYERTLEHVGSFGKRDPVAKIWWDIRPHPVFDTLEFRIADICTRVDECVSVSLPCSRQYVQNCSSYGVTICPGDIIAICIFQRINGGLFGTGFKAI